MAGLLVPLVFTLAVLAVAAARNQLGFGHSFREAALAAGTIVGTYIWTTVELLGHFHAITKWPVRGCWIAAAFVLAGIVWRKRECLRGYPLALPRLEVATVLYGILCVVVLVGAGWNAACSPATNIDGLLYHQPRQLQWLQAGTVAHFPTQDYRLTVNPPFAEYCGLTLDVITGRDSWVNLPQWAAFAGSLLIVSMTAKELGASQTGQCLAAALAVTLPIAVQQAASPKNDITAACWLAAVGYWTVRAWSGRPLHGFEFAMSGLAIGLLALTKGTGMVFAIPAVLLGAFGLIVQCHRRAVKGLSLAAALALLVPLSHWSRNLAAYGTVSGQTFGLPVHPVGVRSVISNLARNMAAQAALPSRTWNEWVVDAVTRCHALIGLSPNDPTTTWQQSLPFHLRFDMTLWEEATAPIHWLLAFIAIMTLPWIATGPQAKSRSVAMLSAIGALLAFSIVFKWQPSNARLLLPVEILFAAPTAVALEQTRLRWLGRVAVAIAAGLLIPIFAVSFAQMPGFGRAWAERWSPESRYGPYQDAAVLGRLTAGRIQLLKPKSIGLVNNTSCGWEYPVSRTVYEWLTPPPRIRYFYPTPEIPDPAPPPDVVIDFSGDSTPLVIRHPGSGRAYRISDRIGPFTVYQPSSDESDPDLAEPMPVARFGVRIDFVLPTDPQRSQP